MRIYKSQLQDVGQFEKAVAQHILELHAHTKTKGVPRPTTHSLVEHSVKRVHIKGRPDTYVPDYEIVDDNPPESPISLDDRKILAVGKLRQAELAVIYSILPERKSRLFYLQVNQVLQKPSEERSTEDNMLLEQHKSYDAKFREIQLKSAKAEAAIEDMTEDELKSWQVPQF